MIEDMKKDSSKDQINREDYSVCLTSPSTHNSKQVKTDLADMEDYLETGALIPGPSATF